jgi:hypothetical protein
VSNEIARAWKKERCPVRIWILYQDFCEKNYHFNHDYGDGDDDTTMGHWSAQT